MIQRHKDRLLSQELINRGFIWTNELEKNKVILNCKKLEWDFLYPNIILQLSNENLIELESCKKRDLKYFIENKATLYISDPDMYNVYRINSNRLYGELLYNTTLYAHLVTTYVNLYYTELIQNNPNIFYIDVDAIYYTGEIDYFELLDLCINYKITVIDSFIFSAKKRYIEITNSVTKAIGYLRRSDLSSDKNIEIEGQLYSVDDLISQMKGLLREQQINSLFNKKD